MVQHERLKRKLLASNRVRRGGIRLTSLLVAAFLSSLTGACTRHAQPRSMPHWSKEGYVLQGSQDFEPLPLKANSESPLGRLAKSNDEPKLPSGATPFGRAVALAPLQAPLGKNACLNALKEKGIQFKTLPALKGVETPVEIRDRLGGVEFWANDGRPLLMDCRLALALEDLRPLFASQGLRRARFSGSYVYRPTKSGRLSHHAFGLAIDIHELTFATGNLSVSSDYKKNVGCPSNLPINRLACSMRDARLFEELLTPDYNYDHHDHLHVSVPRIQLP